MRFLINLAITLVLAVLIATPAVLSSNLVDFQKTTGISVYDNSSRFGEFLKLTKPQNNLFNLEFKTFPNKSALYSGILEVENQSEFAISVRIINYSSDTQVFFDADQNTQGPQDIKLAPNQRIGISLLALPLEPQIKTASFSLEVVE